MECQNCDNKSTNIVSTKNDWYEVRRTRYCLEVSTYKLEPGKQMLLFQLPKDIEIKPLKWRSIA